MAYKANSIYSKISSSIKQDPENKEKDNTYSKKGEMSKDYTYSKKGEQEPIQGPKTQQEASFREDVNPSVRDMAARAHRVPYDADTFVGPSADKYDGNVYQVTDEGAGDDWDNKYSSTEEFIGGLRGNDLKGIVEYEGADTPEERAKAYKTLRKPADYDGEHENEYEGWQTEEGVVTDYDTAYKDRNRDTYGDMSKEEYIEEAKRQKKSFIDTGDFDAPTDKLVNSTPYKQKGFSGIQKQKRKY